VVSAVHWAIQRNYPDPPRTNEGLPQSARSAGSGPGSVDSAPGFESPHRCAGEQRFAHLRFEFLPEEIDSIELYLGSVSTNRKRFELPRISLSKAQGLYLIPVTLPPR
jgi:hypothetical protein